MYLLKVGELFIAGVTHYQEGIKFNFDDSGAFLMYLFSSPTDKEISCIRKGDYSFKVCEFPNVMFFLSKFGSMNWEDAPYSPHLSKSFTFQTLTEGMGYGLTVVLVDAATGVLKGMRTIGLPTKFSLQLKASIERYLQQAFDNSTYLGAIDVAYAKYSVEDMVRIAQY